MLQSLGNTLASIGGNYAVLAVVLAACWGIGSSAFRRIGLSSALPGGLHHPTAIAVGLGTMVCLLQALALAGHLRSAPVLLALAFGVLLACLEAWRWRAAPATRRPSDLPGGWAALPFVERCALIVLLLVLASTMLMPLSVPLQWDELMYHLPHAREWAASGRLQVNDWLRYPWFPYNYDLLYAAALLFDSTSLAHMVHAAAGWLTAWLIYQLGLIHLGRIAACLAAVIWVVVTASDYDRAYVDMGVALFVLTGSIGFAHWRSTRARGWLAVSAFALGVAAGSKYQVLALLPFFAIALLWYDRRWSTWLIATLALAVPCLYWYVRNAFATGDPFAPVGGRVFGFSDWNLSDYQAQFEDLRKNRGLPHWALWPALLAPWLPALRRSPHARGAMILATWMMLVWVASSPYPRYLMSAFPLLALLAAAGWMQLWQAVAPKIGITRLERLQRLIAALLLACVALTTLVSTARFAKRIATTPAARDALLLSRVKGYGLWRYTAAHPVGKVYQIGLEGSLYYAPRPIRGDAFGPWRYRDYADLPPEALYRRLSQEGFEALAINIDVMPAIASAPGFDRWFIPLHTEGGASLYRLAPSR